jgi:hypothetical protein
MMNMQNLLYWGDLHNHNEVGYGEGSLDRSFRIAENSLDFYAFTPHTWWPDLPDLDPKVREKHLKGFAVVRKRWEEVIRLVNQFYKKDEFVTFPAWEWHSLRWGDWCVYFPGSAAEYRYAETLDELKQFASDRGAVIIPHHCGYAKGFRGTDWDSFDADHSPVVEVFSEHGDSMEEESPFGMYGHSMGGSASGQAALLQIEEGKRFGIIAGTDDHYGYPGSYGYGLTGVWAPELSREGIWEALKARRVYGVTGDRIRLAFFAGEVPMGGTYSGGTGRVPLRVEVAGRAPLERVEILKNGYLYHSWDERDFRGNNSWLQTAESAEGLPEAEPLRLFRIEWGWDLLSAEDITKWEIDLRSDTRGFRRTEPSFAGGAGSVEMENRITRNDPDHITADSFTSRKNGMPVSSLSFMHPKKGKIFLNVTGVRGEREFKKEWTFPRSWDSPKGEMIPMMDYFSSPKVKIHRPLPPEQYSFKGKADSAETKAGDWYLARVIQKNGQKAWSSPIWIK